MALLVILFLISSTCFLVSNKKQSRINLSLGNSKNNLFHLKSRSFDGFSCLELYPNFTKPKRLPFCLFLCKSIVIWHSPLRFNEPTTDLSAGNYEVIGSFTLATIPGYSVTTDVTVLPVQMSFFWCQASSPRPSHKSL